MPATFSGCLALPKHHSESLTSVRGVKLGKSIPDSRMADGAIAQGSIHIYQTSI
jgi:hypothetical protein